MGGSLLARDWDDRTLRAVRVTRRAFECHGRALPVTAGATITRDVGEFLRLLGSAESLPELRDLLRRHLMGCHARSRFTDADRIAADYLRRWPE